MAVGDFNGDGKLDLAVANFATNDVSVLLGNGDGTFQTAMNFGAGTQPESLVTGDFNGDGILDLAVANDSAGNVSMLVGNGDGTFQPAVNYDAGTVSQSRRPPAISTAMAGSTWPSPMGLAQRCPSCCNRA